MYAGLSRWLGFGKSRRKGGARPSKSAPSAQSARPTKGAGRNAYAGNDTHAAKPNPVSPVGALHKKSGALALRTVKHLAGIVLCAVIGCVFLLGVGVGSMWLYRFATTSPFFATKQVDVVGNVRISREMVMDYAGLHVGDNSLAVSIAKVERALLQTPWVEEVSVKRLLPDRFVVRVQERLPSFWVRKDGALYYADARGTIIAPVETHNFLALPTLVVHAGGEEILENLAEYHMLLRSGRLPVEFGAVSSVSLTPAKGVEIYLEDRELRFSIATEDFKGNLERLGITLADLARRNALGAVREIRAADGNVWVLNSG